MSAQETRPIKKVKESAMTSMAVKDYVSSGGSIEQIEPGVTAETYIGYNNKRKKKEGR